MRHLRIFALDIAVDNLRVTRNLCRDGDFSRLLRRAIALGKKNYFAPLLNKICIISYPADYI